MIDYLEDLLEEETAVELTGALLTPVGRRSVPPWQEDEDPAGEGQGIWETAPRAVVEQPEEEAGRVGSPSWAEGHGGPRPVAAELLGLLTRTALAAGQIRQQGRPLTVTLTGEDPAAGAVDLEAVDRAVQRDARRYDGGFPLY